MSAYGIATTPVSAAIVTSASVAPTSSPVKDVWPSRGVAQADAGAAAEEAAEVVGLGQRALAARRGDLERVALADLGQQRG